MPSQPPSSLPKQLSTINTQTTPLAHAEMRLHGSDVWGHFAPLFHLVDVFAVYAVTLVGGRHVVTPAFNAADCLLTIGEVMIWAAHEFARTTFPSKQHHQPPANTLSPKP
jgi:hypothetical protein